MSEARFYGSEVPKSLSYLEFGAIDLSAGEKKIWDFRLHQQAYDWLMLARYSNDLVTYQELTEMLPNAEPETLFEHYKAGMHHPNDALLNLEKLCTLAVSEPPQQQSLSFFELGQTLFGCIEGMVFVKNCLQQFKIALPKCELEQIEWKGVDISRLFNRLSKQLHAGYRVSTQTSWLEQSSSDVFFAKGVTLLYAISDMAQLWELLKLSTACLFDYSFSINGRKEVILGTGKSVHYLPVQEFLAHYRSSSRKFYVRKSCPQTDLSKGRLFAAGIFADPDFCNAWIKLLTRIENQFRTIPALASLFQIPAEPTEWLEFEAFLALSSQTNKH